MRARERGVTRWRREEAMQQQVHRNPEPWNPSLLSCETDREEASDVRRRHYRRPVGRRWLGSGSAAAEQRSRGRRVHTTFKRKTLARTQPKPDPVSPYNPIYGSFSLDWGRWFLTLKLLIISNVLILVCMLFGYACRIISWIYMYIMVNWAIVVTWAWNGYWKYWLSDWVD